jgi:hypothetical protein
VAAGSAATPFDLDLSRRVNLAAIKVAEFHDDTKLLVVLVPTLWLLVTVQRVLAVSTAQVLDHVVGVGQTVARGQRDASGRTGGFAGDAVGSHALRAEEFFRVWSSKSHLGSWS